MAQHKSSIPLSTQYSRGGRSGRSSPQSRKSPTCSQASSQHSDSSSEHNTPPTSMPNTPRMGISTPSVGSGGDHAHTPSLESSPSDAEPLPNGNEKPAEHKGKEHEVYRDSEALESITTRLSRMEAKLDKLLSREKKIHHEETLETATNERIQSSQICHDLEAQNERLGAELHTARERLDDSRQAQLQTQVALQDLQVAKDRSENEARECKAQSRKDYDTMRGYYLWAEENWNRTADEREEAWYKAKEYERENDTLKQKISSLQDVNKELAGRIKVYDLEKIRRKESQQDGESQTEPCTKPTNMESRGTETSFTDWDPKVDGEMEFDAEGELEPTEIEDGEQVEQDNRQEDQQQGLQDALQHDQHEVPQEISEVREEQREGQQEDPQQEEIEGKPEAEPDLQRTGEQEEPQKQSCDCQDEAQKDGTTRDSQANRKQSEESEEDISHKEIARGEEELGELLNTTQELATEPESPEQQGMVETAIGNGQPAVEATAEQSPPETQDVAVVDTTPEPDIAEPVDGPDSGHVTSTERRPKRDRRRYGRPRNRRRKDQDHERNRDRRRDRDERQNHRPGNRNDRPRNTEYRIQRRQQQTQATQWIWSRSWMKRHFGVRLRRLIPMLDLSLW